MTTHPIPGDWETIKVERTDDGIVTMRLNRPDKLNAQTRAMWNEFRALGSLIGDDTNVRALVVSGEGRSFSAGLDVAVLTGGLAGSDAADVELEPTAAIRRVQEGFAWLNDAPFPTVAAVQGHAYGAGCQLAMACDIRIAADDAKFGLLEHRFGIMPDLGATLWLPRLVGPAKALELMWTTDTIDASTALDLGLVNHIVPTDELGAATDQLVARLVAAPPVAVRTTKRAVYASLPPAEPAWQAAAEAQAECLASDDLKEAGAAFIEQRTPNYAGH